jgi:hypothetical protein
MTYSIVAVAAGDIDAAVREYRAGLELLPGNMEIQF